MMANEKAYEVMSKAEDQVIVKVGKATYALSPAAFNLCALAIEGGGDPSETFDSMANQISAKSAKAYDAEKAAKAAKRAEEQKAIEELKAKVEGLTWPAKVNDAARRYAKAQATLEELEESPIVVSLEGYKEVPSSKGCKAGEYRFTSFTVQGNRQVTLVVGLKADHAITKARNTLEDTRLAFSDAAMKTITPLVPEVLKDKAAALTPDIDDGGNIVVNFGIKASRGGGGGGGGAKKAVLYKGNRYESLTELGKAVNGTAKYPHKAGSALVDAGKAKYVD